MVVAVALFAIALAARALTAAPLQRPDLPRRATTTPTVARELAAGHGFQLDYIWNFVDVGGRLPAEGVLPIPSNAHWMPLAALIQVPFIWLLGPTAVASALPFWLLAACVAPLTYVIGADAGMARWQAAAAGLLAALPGDRRAVPGPDRTTSRSSCCSARWRCGCAPEACAAIAARSRWAAWSSGLAFLSRNDGVLLGVPFALAFAYDAAAASARVAHRLVAGAGVPAGLRRRRRAVAVAPAGRLRVHLAIVRQRAHPVHPGVSRALQRLERDDAVVLPGPGPRAARS